MTGESLPVDQKSSRAFRDTPRSRSAKSGLANQQHEPKPARLGVFQLEDEDGWSAGVCATSGPAAIRHWNTEINQQEGELTATRIPDEREVPIWWIDDKPEAQDVPEGGRIEPWPQDSNYLGVIATAAQWCAYYAKSGRDFFIMWEADW